MFPSVPKFYDENNFELARGCALGQIAILNIKTRKTRQNSFVKNSTACNPKNSPTGTQDNELFVDFKNMPCLTPSGLQAREKDGDGAMSTTQNVEFSLLTGLRCMNSDNVEGCKNYEIRVCCPDKLGTKCNNYYQRGYSS